MDGNDFINWFGNMIDGNGNSGNNHISDEELLDEYWSEYDSLVQDLKADGYKVYRNSAGKHKVVKE